MRSALQVIIKNHKDKLVTGGLVLGVFLFLFFTRTLTSGFHFVDDHEVIKMNSELQSTPLGSVIKNWVSLDLNGNARFRPLYYVVRVIQTKVFGTDFTQWSVFNAILCCLACISFYFGMRNLKFSDGESLVFLIIVFVGPQSSVWWRLGPGEGLGMVFLGFAFYYMTRSASVKYFTINNLLFILFLILASLTKESYLIIIPAMIFFKIWHDKDNIWATYKESVIKNFLLIIPLIVLFVELYIIRYQVGVGYAGLDSNMGDLFAGFIRTIINLVKTYIYLIIICLILLVITILQKKRIVFTDYKILILFSLILIPNIILYSKTGLAERYLLPSTFGLAFLVISWIAQFDQGSLRRVALILVVVAFIPSFFTITAEAREFYEEGRQTNELLTSLSKHYQNGSQVMVVVDPVAHYEKSVSLKTYLFNQDAIDLYGYPLVNESEPPENIGYIEGWKSYFDGKQYEQLKEKPAFIIFMDAGMVNKFFEASKIPSNTYQPVALKKSSLALLELKR